MLPEYFRFLDDLRESEVTNMYGAAPYLVKAFGLQNEAARIVLRQWMNTFSDETPEVRATKVM